MPTIDVIIPAYNCLHFIDKAIASCACQILDEDWKLAVTVVDDCSTDGDYHTLADKWIEIIDIGVVHTAKNSGVGVARQCGIDNTHGDFFTCLDADDCFEGCHALRDLLRNIGNNDVIMGQFVEETDKGYSVHEDNFTWVHGKIFRRAFIERHNIRFPDYRNNEDSGYNGVIQGITDRIVYSPIAVYSWNCNKGSTVRSKHEEYKYAYGWRDLVRNVEYVVSELLERHIDKARIMNYVCGAFAGFYYQLCDSKMHMPEELEKNWAVLKMVYQSSVRPFVLDGAVSWEFLQKCYYDTFTKVGIPFITYKDYWKELGYFDDLKEADYCGE